MKSLTIVIPVHNRASMIAATLDSVAAQTNHDFKVVIVDNNSSDGSYVLVDEWIKNSAPTDIDFQLIREFTPGASAARNAGARLADTPYISFFDSDDTMRPDFVESILEVFRDKPGTDLVHWRRRIHFESNRSFTSRFTRRRILEFHVWHSLLSTQAWAARTSVFLSTGGWNERLLQWDDWELGIRLACIPSLRTAAIPRSLVDIYAHGASISGPSYTSRVGGWERALEEAFKFSNTISKQRLRKHLRRLLFYKATILAANYRREGYRRGANAIMSKIHLYGKRSPLMGAILEFSYIYTAIGLRGCASIVGRLL